MPTSLKNLMVTGVFGEKVRLRRVHASCTHLQLLFGYLPLYMQSTHLMSRFPVNYAHNIGKPVYSV